MMWKFLIIGLLLCNSAVTYAQTPDSELKAVLNFLNSQGPDKEFLRFFSTAFVAENETVDLDGEKLTLRQLTEPILNFWIHSISAGSTVEKLKRVPNSNSLFYVDLRNYGWTAEAWEKVAQFDPYFRRPWVEKDTLDAVRIIAGNALLRADWFIIHTSDTTRQIDIGVKDPLYYELLYAQKGIPKNINDFRKAWGVDIDKIKQLQILTGTVLDDGQSGVARHNRQLIRSRIETGYYHETNDVNNQEKENDYLENIQTDFRDKFAAGEVICTNYVKMQVYMLFDGKGNRVDIADNAIAVDKSDPDDKRVRTAKSCVVCHATGLNEPSNAFNDYLEKGNIFTTYEHQKYLDIKRFFLSDYLVTIKDDQELFSRGIEVINGLTPTENALIYRRLYDWYSYVPLNLSQASIECGVTQEVFKEKIFGAVSGRLGVLLGGGTVPRDIWESVNTGTFAVAMLHLYNLEPIPVVIVPPVIETPVKSIIECVEAISAYEEISNQRKLIINIPIGTKLEVMKSEIRNNQEMYQVTYQNKAVWINKSKTKMTNAK